MRPDAPPDLAEQYAAVSGGVSVWGAAEADHLLRLRFDELDARTQAAALGLDPVRDSEEYAALTDLLVAREDGHPVVTGLADLLGSASPATRRLGVRASNLGVLDWSVWSRTDPSLLHELEHPTSRCVVVDLGSLPTVGEQRLVADAVLAGLWRRRQARRPVLVVVDEAHNVCAADPVDELARTTSDRAVQIAAEGRKFGLYLLVSTQRPGKVHENVVSQCDNVVVMRMNSASDLVELQRLFSYVPPGLVGRGVDPRPGAGPRRGPDLSHGCGLRADGGTRVAGGGSGRPPHVGTSTTSVSDLSPWRDLLQARVVRLDRHPSTHFPLGCVRVFLRIEGRDRVLVLAGQGFIALVLFAYPPGASGGTTLFSLGLLAQAGVAVGGWLLATSSMLAGRVPIRTLGEGAVLSAALQLVVGWGTAIYVPQLFARNAERYGAVGVALALVTWLIAVASVVVGGAVIGAVLGGVPAEAVARTGLIPGTTEPSRGT